MTDPSPPVRRRRGRPAENTVAEVVFAPAEPELTPAAARALLELLRRAEARPE
ncbi:hypothetical protein GCM10009839_46710 [Catenulispora yoronensis]|uniref:Uncharacterized protein n=1 Tax=Catenulispora yoronensis TaxID=450799 RepID=A0ABN2UL36_9ACTN